MICYVFPDITSANMHMKTHFWVVDSRVDSPVDSRVDNLDEPFEYEERPTSRITHYSERK